MPRRTQGLLLLGHGSLVHPDSSIPVRTQANALRDVGLYHEVAVGFWKEEPNLHRALDWITCDDIYIVPYFISQGYFTTEIIPRELGLTGTVTRRGSQRLFYTDPVGLHPAMTDALKNTVLTILSNEKHTPALDQVTLVLVGHGTTANERSAESIHRQVQLLKKSGTFFDVLPAFMEQEPYDHQVLDTVQTPEAIVIPFFISDGFHSREEIPLHMKLVEPGIPLQNPVHRRSTTSPLRRVWYTGTIGMEPRMKDVILDQVQDVRKLHPPESLETPEKSASTPHPFRALKNGQSMVWGPLAVTRIQDAYEISHREDLNSSTLRVPGAIRDCHLMIRKSDENRYRPSLSDVKIPRGWIYRDLNFNELLQVIDSILPGALHDWNAYQGHQMPTLSYLDFTQRQTGIYQATSSLTRQQWMALTEKTCELQCVRTRCWNYDSSPSESKPLSPDSLPCPAPCHWLLEQARLSLKQN